MGITIGSSKMIFLLKGGLGNLLYQYFMATDCYPNKNIKFLNCTKAFKNSHDFHLTEIINTRVYEIRYCGFLLYVAVFIKKIGLMYLFRIYTDELPKSKPLIAHGYFQDTQQLLGKCIDFENHFTVEFKTARERFAGHREFIAVHVRRGDYVGSIHDICDEHWYEKAIKLARKNSPGSKVVCFTDDRGYCLSSNFDKLIDMYHADTCPTENNFIDEFAAFSSCGQFVIPNSTFSVWATIFAKSQTIYAPEFWLKGIKTKDCPVYDEKWILVK